VKGSHHKAVQSGRGKHRNKKKKPSVWRRKKEKAGEKKKESRPGQKNGDQIERINIRKLKKNPRITRGRTLLAKGWVRKWKKRKGRTKGKMDKKRCPKIVES